MRISGDIFERVKKYTWEEDDVHQYITWGAFADLDCIVNSCRLFRNTRAGNYLVRLSISNGNHGAQIAHYCRHMENLCYGDDLNGRARVIRVYPRKNMESTNNISIWFEIIWPEKYQIIHHLKCFGTIQKQVAKWQ